MIERLLPLVCLAAALPSLLWASSAADVCAPTADPCTVTTAVAITPGSLLDFGARELRLSATGSITVTASGTVNVNAGSLTMLPGALLSAVDPLAGGNLVVRTTGAIDIRGVGTNQARIQVSSNGYAGVIDLGSSAGTITVDGELFAEGSSLTANGGTIWLSALGGILATNGQLSVVSGDQGTGGEIRITSTNGSVDMGQPIDASGGDGGGGSVDIEAGTDIVTRGRIDVGGGGFAGDGGFVRLAAGGAVHMLGPMFGPAVGTAVNGGGNGADLDIVAGTGDAVLAGLVTNTGGAPDGNGGSVTVTAGRDITQTGELLVAGPGLDGCGGEVDLLATRNVQLGRMDASGGNCGAGTISVQAGTSVVSPAQVIADSPEAGAGGSISIDAPSVAVSSVLRTTGPVGYVTIRGCTIGVTNTAILKAFGANARTSIQASGQLTLQGAVQGSTAGTVDLEYRDPIHPPVFVPNLVNPAPTVTLNPSLPPCAGSGTSTTLGTTTTTASTTTTTTVPGDLALATRSGRTGCFLEWKVRNPNGAISNGQPDTTQTCIDGDPSCDVDQASNGECQFAVSACLGVTDARLPLCQPATLDVLDLDRPTTVSPADTTEHANASALVANLQSLDVKVVSHHAVLHQAPPLTGRDHCTAPTAIRVPHAPGVVGKRLLIASATGNGRQRQRRNRVTLACAPNSAVCGNAVTEVGEACDDGNAQTCDGCSNSCRIESCGDGLVACQEECDDGPLNGSPGAACTAQCTQTPPAMRIPGGGTPATDCGTEYVLALGSPALDRFGLPSAKQTCIDNDPTCDFDSTQGQCRLHGWVCAAGADSRLPCESSGVTAIAVTKPTFGALTRDLTTAIGAMGVPLAGGETCSQRFGVPVLVGRKGIVLQTVTQRADGSVDRDKLKIRCAASTTSLVR